MRPVRRLRSSLRRAHAQRLGELAGKVGFANTGLAQQQQRGNAEFLSWHGLGQNEVGLQALDGCPKVLKIEFLGL